MLNICLAARLGVSLSSGHSTCLETSATPLEDPKPSNTYKVSPFGPGMGRIWEDTGLHDVIGNTLMAQQSYYSVIHVSAN